MPLWLRTVKLYIFVIKIGLLINLNDWPTLYYLNLKYVSFGGQLVNLLTNVFLKSPRFVYFARIQGQTAMI